MSPRLLSRRDWFRISFVGLGVTTMGFARADDKDRKSRIYLTANLGENDEQGKPTQSLIAIDPETGESTTIFSGCRSRLRVSPDGRQVAYGLENAVWVRDIEGEPGEPHKVMDVDDTSACIAVWSSDNKTLIISPGKTDDASKQWRFRSFQVKAGGGDPQELPIPEEDCVEDWTPDADLVLTASSRNAEIGWQLYVMKPDGTDARQVTEGGNPFYTRLSPDGKKFLYTDGTSEERRGIWVSDIAGKDRKRVFPSEKDTLSTACFAPDGKRIAVISHELNVQAQNPRLDVVDLATGESKQHTLPDGAATDMPDWR
jgi:Tol biopolymer transport system component